MAVSDSAPRTYGNWRRPRSGGLFGLQRFGTMVMFAGLVFVVMVAMTSGLLRALVAFALVAGLLYLVVRRDRHGKSLAERLRARLLWWTTQRSGAHLYRSGPLGWTGWGTHQLPGIAASLRLSEHRDAYGAPFAMIGAPATDTYTVVFAVTPEGASLVDVDQVDRWVANWGRWLATLGDEASVEGCAVTIQTSPDTGHRLHREVMGAMDPNAPQFARDVLAEVVAGYPSTSSVVRGWVTLTFSATSPSTGATRDPDEMGRDLAARLPGLASTLSATGAGAARPVTASELCEIVRVAYSPHTMPIIEAARGAGEPTDLHWADVGPAAAVAGWDGYRHDDAYSTTWAMSEAPRGTVHSTVLARLLAPHPDIDLKRVTLTYRVFDAGAAAAIVEADLRDAEFVASAMRRPSARAVQAARAAQATAAEEAAGAGLVMFAMIVTATVTDPDRARLARAAIDTATAAARLRLRPVYGAQPSAFAAGLPLGIMLPKHLSAMASTLKDRM